MLRHAQHFTGVKESIPMYGISGKKHTFAHPRFSNNQIHLLRSYTLRYSPRVFYTQGT
jgi:hypothetical protein